jgi:hypothetical protein
MTFPGTLKVKNVVNDLSFPVVTHIVDSDARFDSYAFLISGQGAEQILDRLGRSMNIRF